MPVIARDTVASDHLVYSWPFPIGPEEYEIACSEDELVVMCPGWTVGDRLGPGRHRWRTPDPRWPATAFFVLTAPVEVSFDMVTTFTLPLHNRPVRLRATGSLQVRCGDPALLVAQFVGLPFDNVNEGVVRSVSRSVERMLARLLTRRVVMGGTPTAVTDPTMLPQIIEELVAYNPAAGAVFGVELMRLGHLEIHADDGSGRLMTSAQSRVAHSETERGMPPLTRSGEINLRETVRAPSPPMPAPPISAAQGTPPPPPLPGANAWPAEASGEIVVKPKATTVPPGATGSGVQPAPAAALASRAVPTPPPPNRKAASVEVPQSIDEITQPGIEVVRTPAPGSMRIPTPVPAGGADEPRGAIVGIGTSHIGAVASGAISGEIPTKIAPGARVLVPGPNGLMQSATVRQLLQGYYELEVGSSGETIWVPMNGVVPEQH